MDKKNSLSAYLIVILAPLCWAGDVVLAKGISEIIPPFSLAFWRWFAAFLILLPFTWNYTKNDWPIAKKSYRIIFLLSFLGMSGFIVLIYTAVQTTTAINSALIQTAMPGAIVFFCLLLYGEKISVVQFMGLSFCFIGAAFVVLQGKISNLLLMSLVLGDILMIIASIMYGLYSSLLQKIPNIHPLSFLTLSSGAASITLFPLYIYEIATKGSFAINTKSISGIFYVAFFPSILAYLCWNKGISTIGANKTGIFITLIPVFAAVLAIFLLGETIQNFHLVGMVLIFFGMVLFNKYVREV